MSRPPVGVTRSGAVTTCALDRPEGGNMLDAAILDGLIDANSQAREDGTRVLVLRANGPDFCLGRKAPTREGVPTPGALHAEFARVQGANELIEDFPGVTVSVVRGRALGAGASLAGRCDVVVAARSSRWAFPEVPHGISPMVVTSYFVHRLGRTALLDLLLTGREVEAAEAQRLGLVSRVVDDPVLDEEVDALATSLAHMAPEVVRSTKAFIGTAATLPPRTAIQLGLAQMINQMVDQASARAQAAHGGAR